MQIEERVFLPLSLSLPSSSHTRVRQSTAQTTGRIWETQRRRKFLPSQHWEVKFMWKFIHRLGDAQNAIPLEFVAFFNLFLILVSIQMRKAFAPSKCTSFAWWFSHSVYQTIHLCAKQNMMSYHTLLYLTGSSLGGFILNSQWDMYTFPLVIPNRSMPGKYCL